VKTLLTVDDDFGGWDEVSTKFFDEENGLIFQAILGAGLSLE
jgi:sulfate transport system substrate-binding protein